MMKIEYSESVQFGETDITDIQVEPLTFAAFSMIWSAASAAAVGNKNTTAQAIMQRKRIQHQTHFIAGGKRVVPTDAQISQLPIPVAKAIIAALDNGEGKAGKIISAAESDGVNSPILYRLGEPIILKINGKDTELAELEFQAKVYGDIEDVLATDGEVPQALELIRKVAKPVGVASLTSLPGWVIDHITPADGITIMREVAPRFLE